MNNATISLLSIVSTMSKNYEKITRLTGENYNIFSILNLTTNEVRTHSAFIGELLNTKGSHGQGDTFLKLFCDVVGIQNFNTSNSKLTIEKYISRINEDYSEGGNIDLIIEYLNNQAIIIENKINAVDQEKQLFRYHNYGKQKYQSFSLLYLTLDGKDASDLSKNGLTEKDYIRISYKVEIKKWLEICKEKSVNHPLLRETIAQYLHLIKKLTFQTMNEQLEQEILTLITASGSNITSAINISNNLEKAKKTLVSSFVEKICIKVKGNNPNVEIPFKENLGIRFKGIIFEIVGSNKEIFLSSFGYMADFYLEIRDKNHNEGKNKNTDDIKYFDSKLEQLSKEWGKTENVQNAYWGVWVCKYYTLSNFFNLSNALGLIADKNDEEITTQISEDILRIIEVVKSKR